MYKFNFKTFLWIIFEYQSFISFVFGYDILTPYVHHHHGSRLTHRDIRECQKSGNQPHEIYPAHSSENITKSFVEVKRFFKVLSSGNTKNSVHGHYAIVSDPLQTISVLEPGHISGCQLNLRQTVRETSKQRKCEVAINAGYFNTQTGNCLGNVISDGRLVQNSGGVQNAHFGLMKDKTIFTGYISEAQVISNDFLQLIGGVVWILRNGTGYVNESKKLECEETEETGPMKKFTEVLSARTVIGNDKNGRVVIVQVDGKTDHYGISLLDMQNLLVELDVINAINLDGGGSATFVVNGTVVNYPSDSCPDEMFICERKISTVLCIHSPDCNPPDCHGHGECYMGLCKCKENWLPPSCDQLKCKNNCSTNGVCSSDGCQCESGFYGEDCSKPCPYGWFGPSCKERCMCLNGASCHPQNGLCMCSSGYIGVKCQYVCPYGYYGLNCETACQCEDSCFCNPVNGLCFPEKNSSMYNMEKCFAEQGMKKQHSIQSDLGKEKKFRYYVIILSVITAISIASSFLLVFYSCTCHCKSNQRFCKKRKQRRYKDLQSLTALSDSSDSDNLTINTLTER